ncbi:WXG100 family type VII secretion target [Streptomyces sp. NBC_01549]|uniref:WXG100 family type VII secretion target n=1 Tax=unclassified Streptomyces TaxID=2593676 RepID=UPI00225BDF74|nr:WXG100 family type VII secretion target [Streptomyces sp. NBC_01549]MCX4598776.1 WXG100 family type VII secretion target [Streptomyces sp. NBC_01549]
MANSVINTDEGMRRAAAIWSSSGELIASLMNTLQSLRSELEATFTGLSATNFDQALQNLLSAAQSVRQSLESITQTMGTHAGIVTDTNQSTGQMGSSIAGQITTPTGLPGF